MHASEIDVISTHCAPLPQGWQGEAQFFDQILHFGSRKSGKNHLMNVNFILNVGERS
jgi:hypothetical protein